MRIRFVDVLGVNGLKDQRFDFQDAGATRKLVVFHGGMGSGKTTLLEAIVMAKEQTGSYGGGPTRTLVRAGADSAKVSIGWELRDEEREEIGGERERLAEAFFGEAPLGGGKDWDDGLKLVLSRYRATFPKLEYFHAERQLPTGSLIHVAGINQADRLTTTNRKFEGLDRFLMDIGDEPEQSPTGEITLLRRFRDAFAELCPGRRFLGLSRRPTGPVALFECEDGRRVALAELSQSEKQVVLFLASFLRAGLDHSVVLIDSPELYLPEERVLPLLLTLEALGDNQLLVATSSSTLAKGVHHGSVIKLGDR